MSSGTFCGGNINQPCASVTICAPGTSNCQTISDILIDTGSYGLRIFSQAINSTVRSALPSVVDGSSNPVGECAQFGSATDWGSVVTADIQLGSEPKVTTSIQVIDKTFNSPPSACSSAESGPSVAGINGILGVGLFRHDCGSGCATMAGYGSMYYGCSGGTCSGTKMTLANQVANPVSLLPTDNNGVMLKLPCVPDTGAGGGKAGALVFGIDTQSNNSSAGYTEYTADSSGNFTTNFNGTNYAQSFIDSGTNVLMFPNPGISICGSSTSASGFFCPPSTMSYTATNSGGSTGGVSFYISNTDSQVQTGNLAFYNVGAPAGSSFSTSFDWGLPFFFGRTVFVGINTKSSNLGTGPYWAY